jgi:hypothetical protein
VSFTSEILADAPLVYCRMGEASGTTLNDSSGNARNGVYFGSPTLGAAGLIPGDSNTAVDFDGSTTRGAYINDAAWMDVTTITVEAVIRLDATGNFYSIVDRDNGGTDRIFQFRISNTSKFEFIYWLSGSGPFSIASNLTLVAGKTYHVAATYDGTTVKLYVNGGLDNSSANAGTLKTGTMKLCIGISESGGGGFPSVQAFNGVIDEVAVHGSALSATRIRQRAKDLFGYYAGEVLSDFPLAYWRMEDLTGASVMVSSEPNGRDGAWNDAPTFEVAGLLTSEATKKACDFNGTADYARIFYASWMDTTAFTVEAIIKPDTIGAERSIIEQNDGFTPVWEFGITAAGKLRFRVWTSGGVLKEYLGATTLTAGTIYHVAASHSGTAQRIYLTPKGSATTVDLTAADTFTKRNNGTTAILGASWSSTFPTINRYFDGILDEVAWYSSAVSQTRITDHATAAFTNLGITVSLATATETDTALDATVSHSVSLTTATETDSALEIVYDRRLILDTAIDTQEALEIGAGRGYVLAQAGDVSSTFALTAVAHAWPLETAVELDIAAEIPRFQFPVTIEDVSLGSFLDPRWYGLERRPFVGQKRRHARYVLPRVQKGLILYRDGRVIQVRDWRGPNAYADADDRIGGGTVWIAQNTSWQAQVLEAAGYTLVQVADDLVTLEEE